MSQEAGTGKGARDGLETRQSRDGGGHPGCTGLASAWAPEPPPGGPWLSQPKCCGSPRGVAGRPPKANEKHSFGPEKQTHSPLTSFQALKVKRGCGPSELGGGHSLFNPRAALAPDECNTGTCPGETTAHHPGIRSWNRSTGPMNLTLLFLAHFCKRFHIFIIFLYPQKYSCTNKRRR